MKNEKDPAGKDPHSAGAKLDAGKPMGALLGQFGLALLEVAKLGTFGAKKYSRGGWQSVPNGRERYQDALWRHLCKQHTEETDSETGLSHEVAVVWNGLAALELKLRAARAK